MLANTMVTNAGSPLNAFTIDLEDWFQGLTSTNPQVNQWPAFESRVVPATLHLLEILRAYRVQATFFILGHVADYHPDLVDAIQADGHEIAIHGYWHRYISRLTPVEFSQELERSIKAIRPITGQMPIGHRAPYISVNRSMHWVFDILQEHGFLYDSSIFPIRNGYYGDPRASRFPYTASDAGFVEFPLSTVRLGGVNWPMAGGFYLRMLPYAFVRWAITRLNRLGQPAILYLHPWELDVDQPRHSVTPRERITHYAGRRRLATKLHRLFSEFQFAPLRTLLEQKQCYPLELGYCDHH
jgi:polysaccharide deacetylase family protein (PEP-CTERM system associated)